MKFSVVLELRVRYYPGDFARQRTVSPALPNPYRRWFRFTQREIEDEGVTKVESRTYSAVLTAEQFIRYNDFFGGTPDTRHLAPVFGMPGTSIPWAPFHAIVFEMAGFDRYHENISGTLYAVPITRRMEEDRQRKPIDTERWLLRIARVFRSGNITRNARKAGIHV